MNWLPLGMPSPEPGAGPTAADATAAPESRVQASNATTTNALIIFLICFTTLGIAWLPPKIRDTLKRAFQCLVCLLGGMDGFVWCFV
jgi:hypothetical protein